MLEGENQQLRSKLVMMERYSRGESLEVHNLPKTDNENVHDLIHGIPDALVIDMSPSDIINPKLYHESSSNSPGEAVNGRCTLCTSKSKSPVKHWACRLEAKSIYTNISLNRRVTCILQPKMWWKRLVINIYGCVIKKSNVTSIAAVPDLRRGRLRSEHKQQINSAGQR